MSSPFERCELVLRLAGATRLADVHDIEHLIEASIGPDCTIDGHDIDVRGASIFMSVLEIDEALKRIEEMKTDGSLPRSSNVSLR